MCTGANCEVNEEGGLTAPPTGLCVSKCHEYYNYKTPHGSTMDNVLGIWHGILNHHV